MKTILLLLFSTLGIMSASDSPKEWHENVDWLALDEALELSRLQNKPVMLIIYKSWCGACKALKPQFHNSKQIGELSKHFLMVAAGDDNEPQEDKYRPDGGYIPRIMFIKDGEVIQDLYNVKGNPKYKFYYNTASLVVNTMTAAVEKFGHLTEEIKEEL